MTLSPQHHLVVELKQQIAVLYGQNFNLLTDKAVRRKIQLHLEIIEVLAVIEPGLSRLKGNDDNVIITFCTLKLCYDTSLVIPTLALEVDVRLINK